MKKNKAVVAAIGLSAITLAGCTTPINSPDNPNRNTQTGALIGATMGAIVGATRADDSDDKRRNAILGAAIGGGLGAIGGNILDRQEAELREQLGGQVGIVNTGDRLIVTMPQDILFATDSATLTGGLQADLSTLAQSMNRYPDTTVQVIGHTDNTGTPEYNQGLSERRANAVSSVLIASGVAPSRIFSFGRGESTPITTNLTEEGRAQNRRVEIVIIPNA